MKKLDELVEQVEFDHLVSVESNRLYVKLAGILNADTLKIDVGELGRVKIANLALSKSIIAFLEYLATFEARSLDLESRKALIHTIIGSLELNLKLFKEKHPEFIKELDGSERIVNENDLY